MIPNRRVAPGGSFGSLAALVWVLSGCAVDMELGLAVDIANATLDVRSEAGGDVVGLSMNVTYRVGAYARESHELIPQAIDVFIGDAVVATIIPDRPPDFVPVLAPGESRTLVFTGASQPGVATDPRRLCDGEALLLFRWADGTTGELGMSETTTTAITCS